MKKVLYGTTALVAGVAFAGAAYAAPIELSIGGHQQVFFGVGGFSDDRPNSGEYKATEMHSDTELMFSGSTTLDNGITVSAAINMEAETDGDGSVADEQYITFSGGFGQFRVGEKDNMAAGMVHSAPIVGVMSDEEYWNAGANLAFPGDNVDNGDTLAVSYMTPSFFGFSAGVAYAPQATTGGQEGFQQWGNNNNLNDFIQAAVAYNGEFSGVGLGASFAWSHAWGDGLAEDHNAYDAGASVSYMGFTVGGAFSLVDRYNTFAGSTGSSSIYWEAGATYENGPYGVGFVFQDAYTEAGDQWGLQFSGNYILAPGINLGAGIFHTQADVDQGNVGEFDVSGTGGIMGVGLSF